MFLDWSIILEKVECREKVRLVPVPERLVMSKNLSQPPAPNAANLTTTSTVNPFEKLTAGKVLRFTKSSTPSKLKTPPNVVPNEAPFDKDPVNDEVSENPPIFFTNILDNGA
jgi:hypothetical protein